MEELIINPVFRDVLPPLSEDTFRGLEADIIRDGCLDTLKVWNNVLLDGHNRKTICEKHGIPYRTEEVKNVSNDDEAIVWIINYQLNKRNNTVEEKRYLIGVRYRQEKKQVGEHKGNQFAKPEIGRNVQIPNTAEKIAAEYKISEKAVRRAEKFADGVDAIAKVNPDLKDKIMSGNSDMTVNKVSTYGKKLPDTKTCNKCGKTLPTSEFYKDRNVCISCKNKQAVRSRNYIEPALRLTAPNDLPIPACDFTEDQEEYLDFINEFYIRMGRYEIMPRAFVGIGPDSDITKVTDKLINRMAKIRLHINGGN